VGVAVALLLALASASSAGGVQIRSDVDCPSAPDVAARLRRMLGPDAPSAATLSITHDASALTLALSDAAGRVVDARTWPANDDCAATAEAFAVIVAAWLGDLPQVTTTVVAPALASKEETVITKAAATPRAPALLTVVLSGGASSPMSRVAPSGIVWTAPALGLDVLARPSASSRGFAGLALFANLPRDQNDTEQDDWVRLSAGPEAGFKSEIDPLCVMASGGVSAGALVARSRGLVDGLAYPTSVYFDVAAFADLRAGLPFGSAEARWDLWLSLRGRASLRPNPYLDYRNDHRLPDSRYEAALLLGGDYSWPW
jgi:hypothetical protein